MLPPLQRCRHHSSCLRLCFGGAATGGPDRDESGTGLCSAHCTAAIANSSTRWHTLDSAKRLPTPRHFESPSPCAAEYRHPIPSTDASVDCRRLHARTASNPPGRIRRGLSIGLARFRTRVCCPRPRRCARTGAALRSQPSQPPRCVLGRVWGVDGPIGARAGRRPIGAPTSPPIGLL